MNTFLYAYIILFPRKLPAVFIILIESMNKINCFLGHCFTFWGEGCVSILFLCFSSLSDQIKYSETPKYLEQYFCDQKWGAKVNICNFSVFEAVTNFSFISETLYAAEISPCPHLKPFSIYLFAFEVRLCWATPCILTGGTPMFSRVKFLFWLFIQQKIIIWC